MAHGLTTVAAVIAHSAAIVATSWRRVGMPSVLFFSVRSGSGATHASRVVRSGVGAAYASLEPRANLGSFRGRRRSRLRRRRGRLRLRLRRCSRIVPRPLLVYGFLQAFDLLQQVVLLRRA
eukprot:7783865-Alexandrium_andersonii.AAC.1